MRFARWQQDGTWARIEACLHTAADAAGELDWHAQVDSTVVRAHQHAAGARKADIFIWLRARPDESEQRA